MTAVPHEGIRRGSARGAGGRIVRPSGGPGQSSKDADGIRADTRARGSRQSADPAGFSGILGGKPVRLVLAGGKIRLGSGAFILLVLGSLSLTLLALLILNTAVATDSFHLTQIKQDSKDLILSEQILNDQLAGAESPAGLEKRATALGMVKSINPVFLQLSDGKILGEAAPARAPEVYRPKKQAVTIAPPDALTTGAGGLAGEIPVPGQLGGLSTLSGLSALGGVTGLGGGENAIDPSTGLPLIGSTGGLAAGSAAGQLGDSLPTTGGETALGSTGVETPLGLVGAGR